MSNEIGFEIGFSKQVDGKFEDVLARTEEALQHEGFGILSHIDVQQAMQKKLGVDFPPFRILGACMPSMAYKALSKAPMIGLMLPCNVVVRQTEDGTSRVEAINAEAMAKMFPDVDLSDVSGPVSAALARVLETL